MSAFQHLDDLIAREVTPREPVRAAVWDALWEHRTIGRVAVRVRPADTRIQAARGIIESLELPDPPRPRGWTPEWREALLGDLAVWLAGWQCPGNGFPSLNVPRFVHGQSQGVCDLFGTRLESQPDGNVYVHPLPPDPERVADLEPGSLETSRYWGAVDYARWARAVTGGRLPWRGPIMTGPLDTANYLLGTTVLMEWVYSEPESVHALLDRITRVIAGLVTALRAAAGGTLHAHHFGCLRGGHDYASECRSLVSAELYEQFEAPRLRQLGDLLGPYAIHSCGNWARTVPSARRDPNLRAMNGQVKENDLAELGARTGGKLTLSIGPSANLADRYLFPSVAEFFRYVLEHARVTQPLEITIAEEEIPTWNRVCAAMVRESAQLAPAN